MVVDAATRLMISLYVSNGCRHDFQMLKYSGILAGLPETVRAKRTVVIGACNIYMTPQVRRLSNPKTTN